MESKKKKKKAPAHSIYKEFMAFSNYKENTFQSPYWIYTTNSSANQIIKPSHIQTTFVSNQRSQEHHSRSPT